MGGNLGTGALLDARGRLIQAGWATAETRAYERRAIKAPPLRIKEWDYYCVIADPYGLALTMADNDYMGFLGVHWVDLDGGTVTAADAMLPFPMGRMALPASADAGDVSVSSGGITLSFSHAPGGRVIAVSAPGFDRGRGLTGELFLAQPAMDRMVIATPFAGAPHAFYYNQKINCLRASGAITIGDQRFDFAPERAFGVLDWGRGVWTYDNTWYWASASGLAGGRTFGLNLGYGFGERSTGSENMAFIDGAAHKLEDVSFEMPAGAPDSGPWRIASADGALALIFTPSVDRATNASLGPILSRQHQVFGRFDGTFRLADGATISVENLPGFAEKVHNRW